MTKTARKPKMSMGGALLVSALLLLALAPPVQATPADAEGGATWFADVATTIQSWIDALAELLTPPDPPTVDEAGVDIEPNG